VVTDPEKSCAPRPVALQSVNRCSPDAHAQQSYVFTIPSNHTYAKFPARVASKPSGFHHFQAPAGLFWLHPSVSVWRDDARTCSREGHSVPCTTSQWQLHSMVTCCGYSNQQARSLWVTPRHDVYDWVVSCTRCPEELHKLPKTQRLERRTCASYADALWCTAGLLHYGRQHRGKVWKLPCQRTEHSSVPRSVRRLPRYAARRSVSMQPCIHSARRRPTLCL
jgi:hypothetical protein